MAVWPYFLKFNVAKGPWCIIAILSYSSAAFSAVANLGLYRIFPFALSIALNGFLSFFVNLTPRYPLLFLSNILFTLFCHCKHNLKLPFLLSQGFLFMWSTIFPSPLFNPNMNLWSNTWHLRPQARYSSATRYFSLVKDQFLAVTLSQSSASIGQSNSVFFTGRKNMSMVGILHCFELNMKWGLCP